MEVATDYTMWALFARATLTVKLVMMMLMAASIWCWAIIVDKIIQYRKARAEAEVFDRAFWSGEPLDALFDQIGTTPQGSSEKIFAAGMLEWRRSHRQDGGLIAGAQARIDRSMDVAILKEAAKQDLEVNNVVLLKRYQRQRQGDNLLMMGAMEGFKRLFEQPDPIVRWLRNTGMDWVNKQSFLKNQIAKHAMGLSL